MAFARSQESNQPVLGEDLSCPADASGYTDLPWNWGKCNDCADAKAEMNICCSYLLFNYIVGTFAFYNLKVVLMLILIVCFLM